MTVVRVPDIPVALSTSSAYPESCTAAFGLAGTAIAGPRGRGGAAAGGPTTIGAGIGPTAGGAGAGAGTATGGSTSAPIPPRSGMSAVSGGIPSGLPDQPGEPGMGAEGTCGPPPPLPPPGEPTPVPGLGVNKLISQLQNGSLGGHPQSSSSSGCSLCRLGLSA